MKQSNFISKRLPLIFYLLIFLFAIEQPRIIINQVSAEPRSYDAFQDGTLMIELAPALCQINSSYSKYRQCSEKTAYVIKGFDAGRTNDVRQKSIKKPAPLQAKMLNRFMPDKLAQQKAWNEYGAYGQNSESSYFRQIIEESSKIKLPLNLSSSTSSVSSITKMNKRSLIKQLKQNNDGLMDSSIHLICKPSLDKSILVRIDLCYKSGRFHQCSKGIDSHSNRDLELCGDEFSVISY